MALDPLVAQIIGASEPPARAPNLLGPADQETATGPMTIQDFASGKDTLFRRVLAGLRTPTPEGELSDQGRQELTQTLRGSISQAEQLMPLIQRLDLSAPDPQNRRQRWSLRRARAMDPMFDRKLKARELELKAQLTSGLLNDVIRASEQLRLLGQEDPAQQEFRESFAREAGQLALQQQKDLGLSQKLAELEQSLAAAGRPPLTPQETDAALRSWADLDASKAPDPLKRTQDLAKLAEDFNGQTLSEMIQISDSERQAVDRRHTELRADKNKQKGEMTPLQEGQMMFRVAGLLAETSASTFPRVSERIDMFGPSTTTVHPTPPAALDKIEALKKVIRQRLSEDPELAGRQPWINLFSQPAGGDPDPDPDPDDDDLLRLAEGLIGGGDAGADKQPDDDK